MNREARAWRRIAAGGAVAVTLLVARLLGMPPLLRLPVSRTEEFERRLHAVEVHLQHLPPERSS